MDKIIEVDTGEVKAGRKNAILRVNATGSCVVIKRRNVFLDVERGNVYYAEGDGSERLLWEARDV